MVVERRVVWAMAQFFPRTPKLLKTRRIPVNPAPDVTEGDADKTEHNDESDKIGGHENKLAILRR